MTTEGLALVAEAVRGLWDHMTGIYKTRVIDKHEAAGMRAVAWALDKMGVLDPDEFMEHYTTTVGHRIYTPFRPGVESVEHPLAGQLRVCAHEHQHIEQFDRDGIKYGVSYLCRAAVRAAYEAEAYRCDMEIHFWLTGKVLDPKNLAQRLEAYACRPADIAVAEKLLKSSAETVKHGGVINAASKKAIAWLEDHAAGLKFRHV